MPCGSLRVSPYGDMHYCRCMTTVKVYRPDDLGPALREVRLERGITQSALAAKANVGRQWLNAFELGDKWTAPLDMVHKVSSALGATIIFEPLPVSQATDVELIDLNLIVDGPADQ